MRLNDREDIQSKGRCEYVCQVDIASNVLHIDNIVVHCFPDYIFLYSDMTETFCGDGFGPVNTCHVVIKDSGGLLLWHVYVKGIKIRNPDIKCALNRSSSDDSLLGQGLDWS
eukprot:3364829-Ditylum_brightwellii.AAC.1